MFCEIEINQIFDQVFGIKSSSIGYISNRPAIIAKDKTNFENGLKIAKVLSVPNIGPILLKALAAALKTTKNLLLSSVRIKTKPIKIAR